MLFRIDYFVKRLVIIFLFISAGELSFAQVRPQMFKISKAQKNQVSNIAISPNSNGIDDIIALGDTVWLGTDNGPSLSTDGGNSWQNFGGTKDFGSEGTSAIGYDNGTFWVATAHTSEINNEQVQVGSGLHYTTDGGNTWVNIPQPTDSSYDSSLVYGVNNGTDYPKIRALPVTVPQQNVTYDIAFTPGTVWITSWASGLRKSTDMGKTWQRVLLPSDSLNEINPNERLNFSLRPKTGNEGNNNHLCFSVIAVNDSTLYVGTADGINKSTDGGVSWVKFNHQNETNAISGNWVVALAYNKITHSIWAGTRQAEDQSEFYAVSYSTDGGQNWKTTLSGETIWNIGFKGQDVICASNNGAFRTNNNGLTWILPTSITEIKNGAPDFTLHASTFYSVAASGNIIWLGSGSGLAKLNETSGQMWKGDWTIYFASAPLKSTSEAYAYPNPFSPRVDQNIYFKYSTGGTTRKVTIRIFDFGMNYVRTIIQNQPRNLSLSSRPDPATWDGRDDKGNFVTNGVYFYRIDVGSGKPIFGKIIVIQ